MCSSDLAKDDKTRLKAIEVWLKCGAAVYGEFGTAPTTAHEAIDRAEMGRIAERYEAEWAAARRRLDRGRARVGRPPLTDAE